MSKEFKILIDRLQSDPKFIGDFLANPRSFLEKLDISKEEKAALLSRDVAALNDLGLTTTQAAGALSGAHSQRCSSNRTTTTFE
ncbi:arginine deiminase [Lactobacillus jensenii]|jgi:hypothetical protein|uniref:Arginine deiminase n=1 Tax=Lactobacillus jensenii TaxID=109790 RepID=A0A5N1I603_LACJE|nr:hypothetical protein [Lactobacillus jensenii]EEQ68397.1 hypothetical protein LBJG_00825 [Lactobacillus jensenii 1153]ERJ42243.1 arginine deiminase [Lactobacillus jensenii MD IIE-70(2)]MCT7874689.1 arginine deiminase [Lactobacillus iners]APT14167.1 arginine deiminase [Lactobacillus jensenii]EEQ25175.1 hypothetical protein LACJE0001_0570 [Lactobacillus jensenii 269-3]